MDGLQETSIEYDEVAVPLQSVVPVTSLTQLSEGSLANVDVTQGISSPMTSSTAGSATLHDCAFENRYEPDLQSLTASAITQLAVATAKTLHEQQTDCFVQGGANVAGGMDEKQAGNSGGPFTEILTGLKSVDEGEQMQSASELAQMLLLADEGLLTSIAIYKPVIVQNLVAFLKKEHNFDLMLTAARCLANLLEVMPRVIADLVEAIPVLLKKLRNIEYIDIAEQVLSALETISRTEGYIIMSADGIPAVTAYVDFFSLPSKRIAFEIAATCAKYITKSEFGRVRECLPDLSQHLFVEDKNCLDSVCSLFYRLVKTFREDNEKIHEIVGQNNQLLKNIQRLLMMSSCPLSPKTFETVMRILRYVAQNCTDLAVALIEMGFVETVRFLIVGPEKDRSHLEIFNLPSEQILEIINFAGELLPCLPPDIVSIESIVQRDPTKTKSLSGRWFYKDQNNEWNSYQKEESDVIEAAYISNVKEIMLGTSTRINPKELMAQNIVDGHKMELYRGVPQKTSAVSDLPKVIPPDEDWRLMFVKGNPDAHLQIVQSLLPVLILVESSSVGSTVRYLCLRMMLRMLYPIEGELFKKVLSEIPMASHIQTALASSISKDICIVASALQLVHLLLDKLPEIFAPVFIREGVAYEVEKLSKIEIPECFQKTSISKEKMVCTARSVLHSESEVTLKRSASDNSISTCITCCKNERVALPKNNILKKHPQAVTAVKVIGDREEPAVIGPTLNSATPHENLMICCEDSLPIQTAHEGQETRTGRESSPQTAEMVAVQDGVQVSTACQDQEAKTASQLSARTANMEVLTTAQGYETAITRELSSAPTARSANTVTARNEVQISTARQDQEAKTECELSQRTANLVTKHPRPPIITAQQEQEASIAYEFSAITANMDPLTAHQSQQATTANESSAGTASTVTERNGVHNSTVRQDQETKTACELSACTANVITARNRIQVSTARQGQDIAAVDEFTQQPVIMVTGRDGLPVLTASQDEETTTTACVQSKPVTNVTTGHGLSVLAAGQKQETTQNLKTLTARQGQELTTAWDSSAGTANAVTTRDWVQISAALRDQEAKTACEMSQQMANMVTEHIEFTVLTARQEQEATASNMEALTAGEDQEAVTAISTLVRTGNAITAHDGIQGSTASHDQEMKTACEVSSQEANLHVDSDRIPHLSTLHNQEMITASHLSARAAKTGVSVTASKSIFSPFTVYEGLYFSPIIDEESIVSTSRNKISTNGPQETLASNIRDYETGGGHNISTSRGELLEEATGRENGLRAAVFASPKSADEYVPIKTDQVKRSRRMGAMENLTTNGDVHSDFSTPNTSPVTACTLDSVEPTQDSDSMTGFNKITGSHMRSSESLDMPVRPQQKVQTAVHNISTMSAVSKVEASRARKEKRGGWIRTSTSADLQSYDDLMQPPNLVISGAKFFKSISRHSILRDEETFRPSVAPILTKTEHHKLLEWIRKEAGDLMNKHLSDKVQGNDSKALSIAERLNRISSDLIKEEDVGIEPLYELKSLIQENDVSMFELNHSGLLPSLSNYLTSTSGDRIPDRNERLRRFAQAVMSLSPDNLRPLNESGFSVPFGSLVSKTLASVAQLEQFQVKMIDLNQMICSDDLLNTGIPLQGSHALRFFQTHMISCAFYLNPNCGELKKHSFGTVVMKVDPLTPVSVIQNLILNGRVFRNLNEGSTSASHVNEISEVGTSTAEVPQQRIDILLQSKVIPPHMTILQAICQYSLAGNPDRVYNLWSETHAFYYQTTTERSALERTALELTSRTPASANYRKRMQLDIDDNLWIDGEIPKRSSPLERYISSSLPVNIDDPCVSSLILLRSLYGINRYWWSIFEGDQVLPTSHAPLLPDSSFCSSKLSAKLDRQMSDFFSVVTEQVPKWIYGLMTAMPFLFSFSSRRNFLYCTAFGLGRTIMHLVNQSGDNNMEGEVGRLTQMLEREKVSIKREDLLRQAQKAIKRLGSSRAVLEVSFDDEAGSGFGPTLEFYSLVSQEVQKASLRLWNGEKMKASLQDSDCIECNLSNCRGSEFEYITAVGGLYPSVCTLNANLKKSRIKKFEFIGRLLAQSLIDKRMLDLPLNPVFFKWLSDVDCSFDFADLEMIDMNLYQSLRSLAETPSESFSSLYTYFTLPGDESFELIKDGGNRLVDKANVLQFIKLVKHWKVFEGVRHEMEAVRRGFERAIKIKYLSPFVPEEMEELFCGCSRATWDNAWSVDSLKLSIKPDHGYSHDSEQIEWLVMMLSSFDYEQKRKFLQFVTGSPKLPVGGFRSLNPPLTVVRKGTSYGNSDDELPSAMTCYNYLKIPAYSTYKVFFDKFNIALNFVYSFHLT